MASRRAYSDNGSDGAYSDDFISDEDRATITPYKYKYGHSREDSRDRTRARASKPRRGGRGRGRGGRGARGGNSRASEPISMKYDNVTKRVMSASRIKINDLRNQVEELKLVVKELEQENKLYKKMQYRQEKAIRGFEDKENDLPRILDKHSNEVRSLKDQNRRLREKYEKSDRYLRDAEDDLEKVKRRLAKYKEICEQKELAERDELSRKLTKAEIDMEERDCKIKELQRHIDVLKKNHRHELGIEVARQKDLKRQLDEMSNKQSKVENQLREKEKALEYNNIYSNRLGMTESNPDISPTRKLKKRAPSLSDLTPRDKAKFYEEKRREEVKKQKEIKLEQERKKREKWEAAERLKEEVLSPTKSNSPSPGPSLEFNFKSIDHELEEREARARQREEEDRHTREENERREMEEFQRKKKDLEKRQAEERRKTLEQEAQQKYKVDMERENNARREREERERQERQERERKEREERERKDREYRERKEQEERDRREKEKAEQERRSQIERQKLDNDPSLREERRKKDELLRKLQEMDKIGNNKPIQDPFVASSANRSKENSSGYDTPGKRSDPKEYSFTRPVNNLHQGKPSHEDVTIPYIQRQHRRASKEDDDVGGYQPSFGPSRGGGGGKTTTAKPLSLFDDDPAPTINTSKPEKKSTNLLENLFGPQANAGNKSDKSSDRLQPENETFFITSNSPASNPKNTSHSSSAFPWDMSSTSPNKNTNSHSAFSNDHKSGSTLFGGGAALIEDDATSSSNRALPRRMRQQNVNTFSVKPSVTAVDAFDDEIEEVVL